MNNFIPHLFISIGAQNHLFTLRQTYVKEVHVGYGRYKKVVSSYHVQNLAQNREEAIVKAREYAKEHGMIFKLGDDLPEDLDEIRRVTREEAAERERQRLQDIEDRKATYEAAMLERHAAQRTMLDNGIFSFGMHQGKKIEDQPGYAAFLVSKKAEFEAGSILKYAANVIETKFAHLLENENYKPGYRPEKEKSRILIKGKVKRVMAFRNSFDGWTTSTTYWVFIRDQNGLCIVTKGSWYAEEGTEVNITGYLKAKETYKGQEQTIVNRIKACAPLS